MRLKTVLCVISLIALATPVSAQTRGFVSGLAGVTFGTETDMMFGGEFGADVNDMFQIFGEAGVMLNVLPSHIQEDLDDAARILRVITGERWDFDATIRNTYFGGGIRVNFDRESFTPYVLGGLGVAALKLKVTETDLGDITDEIVEQAELGDDSESDAMMSLGGGVMFPVGGSAFVDVGYRFHKIFTEESVNISRVYGGVGILF
jgi:hypothetical protein